MPQDGPCSIRVIEGAVTPRACTASCRRRQLRLTLSWCSRFLLLLDVALQYLLRLEAGSNIYFHNADLAIQALDGGISSTDTVTRSLTPPTSPTRSHSSLKYDLRLK
ncbi:hypothetical protein P692DRAFT_20841415 [Suillus brevipes Sb2]|nr:hypothetical protein P692DRAFT_20841415 [Suillus brevipes Sb2]